MARYRDYDDDDRRASMRNERDERERPWNFNESFGEGRRWENDYRQERFGRGRFGERANYQSDEPRYTGSVGGYGYDQAESRSFDRDYEPRRRADYGPGKSRLRVRDIMTRDLTVGTPDTSLVSIAIMMKEEDTGVIPIVENDGRREGNGSTAAGDRPMSGAGFNHGKLVGVVTDRDIVVRAVAEKRDCGATRADEIMSTDLLTANPNDRVVDILRKMGSKQVRRIPVVSDNGYLRGICSMADIALETEADRELSEALEDISKESSFWGRIFS